MIRVGEGELTLENSAPLHFSKCTLFILPTSDSSENSHFGVFVLGSQSCTGGAASAGNLLLTEELPITCRESKTDE